MTFVKGQSGNPAGRRPGSRSRVAALLDQMAEGDAGAVYQVIKGLALGGDLKAAELILARAWPVPKNRRVGLDLPPLRTPADATAALAAIAAAVASGGVSPDDGRALAVLIAAWRVSATAAGASPPGDYADDLDFSGFSDHELKNTLDALNRAALAARRRRAGGGGGDDAGGGPNGFNGRGPLS